LVEQDFELGGDLLNESSLEVEEKLNLLVLAVAKAGVRIIARTTAFGLYENGTAGLLERVTDHLALPTLTTQSAQAGSRLPRQRFWIVRSEATILATGALERSIAFENNDRPGVMTVAAARTYLNRFGVLPGQRIVIAVRL
jgi:NADPH-dependent 2,4-dienoyl-CoA reductase/sulfur reductase-like enzyme